MYTKVIVEYKEIRKSQIILVGSINELDNNGSKQVTYAASKFGLRYVGHSLRENWGYCYQSSAAAIPYED
jgi:hypothetical protein